AWSTDRTKFIQLNLEKERKRYNRIDVLFYKTLQTMWDGFEETGEVTEEDQGKFTTLSKRIVATVVDITQQLYRLIGMNIVKESTILNQLYRDIHTASQHTFLMPTNNTEATPY